VAERLVIGTRGSPLALTQTHAVADALRAAHPSLDIDIRTIQTLGDKTQAANVPLSSFGEKGIFAKELEAALLGGEIDLAVHSLKDMAHTLPPGLHIAAVPLRQDARDCLVGSALHALPLGAIVGTGSVRRRALLLSRRPDLECREIRGNIDTRLRKGREGEYHAICLAVAGLNRLGLQEQITEVLDPAWFTPDPGQGALALETRKDDWRINDLVGLVNHAPTHLAIQAERAFLRALGGGCQTPLGAFATIFGQQMTLTGMAAAPDGSIVLRETLTRSTLHVALVGKTVAEALRAAGADALLGADDAREA